MARLSPISRNSAPQPTQKLLVGVEDQLGMVPNLVATMAQSTSVARAYLGLANSLSEGVLEPALREQIALTVSQAHQCDYCVAGHSAVASSIGLTDDEVRDARQGTSPDRKTEAVLQFARRIVEKRGRFAVEQLPANSTCQLNIHRGHLNLNPFPKITVRAGESRNLGDVVRKVKTKVFLGVGAGEKPCVVYWVAPSSPASDVGLKEDDVILRIDNVEVDGFKSLSQQVSRRKRGKKSRAFVA